MTSAFQACRLDSECSTGFCVEGVCCDTRCDIPCHSCALLTSPGVCSPEPFGVDLKQDCGHPRDCIGTCSGGTKCIGAGPGSLCSRNRCTSPSGGVGAAYCKVSGQPCDDSAVVAFDCAPFACDPALGACRTLCSVSTDCAAGSICDVPSRTCVAAVVPSDDGGGCSTGAAGGARAGAVYAALALALGLARRRRAPR